MKVIGVLKNINVGELSFVSKGSNKKKYTFTKDDKTIEKQDLLITIKSNGTAEGTTIRVNSSIVEDIKDFSFILYRNEEPVGANGFGASNIEDTTRGSVECSYTLQGKEKNGFNVSNRYYLMKNDMEVTKLMKREELVKQYFGDGEKVEKKDEDSDAIEKSLEVINEYKESFPEELRKSVGVLMKQALSVPEKTEESKEVVEEKTDVKKDESDKTNKPIFQVEKKDAAEVSDEDKISKIVKKVLGEMGTPESKDVKKDAGANDIDKKLENVTELINKKDEVIAELTSRLEKVEKIKGIKKSIDGQDVDGTDIKKTSNWPSFEKK